MNNLETKTVSDLTIRRVEFLYWRVTRGLCVANRIPAGWRIDCSLSRERHNGLAPWIATVELFDDNGDLVCCIPDAMPERNFFYLETLTAALADCVVHLDGRSMWVEDRSPV